MPRGETKQRVMDVLSSSGPVKFSKYSGIAEFRNAVILWVNVGGRDYENQFLDQGRKMTWFAGSRHVPETPVIQRLLAGDDTILLFCRIQPGAYVLCGRVSRAEIDLEVHPLRFTWNLDDFDAMRSMGNKQREIEASEGVAEEDRSWTFLDILDA